MSKPRTREQARQYTRKWRAANPEKAAAAVWRSHGRPTPTRPRPSVCECCGNPPGKRPLFNDHDHITGKFRGWLCMNCNTALGHLGDSYSGVIRRLSLLLSYLNRADLS